MTADTVYVLRTTALTPQTQRDLNKISKRKNKNGFLLQPMARLFQSLPKTALLRLAKQISQSKQIPPADRICRRNRDALICWFCESAPELLSGRLILPPAVFVIPEVARQPTAQPRLVLPSVNELLANLPDDHILEIL
jgi:hypothetical protein